MIFSVFGFAGCAIARDRISASFFSISAKFGLAPPDPVAGRADAQRRHTCPASSRTGTPTPPMPG